MKETKCILQEAKAAVSSLAVLKSKEKKKKIKRFLLWQMH